MVLNMNKEKRNPRSLPAKKNLLPCAVYINVNVIHNLTVT